MDHNLKALRITQKGEVPSLKPSTISLDDLGEGDVVFKVAYSSLNYKDALAVTGKGTILKKFPLVPGIDGAGTVVEAGKTSGFKAGDEVLVTGCGFGESQDGGYSQYARVPATSVIKIPKGYTSRHAMAFGTAGFTAGLAYERLLWNHQTPEMGPFLVTGASGGVGSVAVQLFSKKKYEVWALSEKREEWPRLEKLGAKKCVTLPDLGLDDKPLQSVKFGGALDNIGGATLPKILAATQLWGNIASVGLAEGHNLTTTVMAFILRGVSLIGISSNNAPRDLREKTWNTLFTTFSPGEIDNFISEEISLDDVHKRSQDMLARKTHGRIIVKI